MSECGSDGTFSNVEIRSNDPDLFAKYSQLSAAYSRVRAEHGILKKAIVEERKKCCELKDVLKDQERKTRIATDEIEALTFRNQQLTKRVKVLQNDLKDVSKSSKSKNKQANNCQNASMVLNEDAKKIMMENAKLICSMNEKEDGYVQQINMLKEKVYSSSNEVEILSNKLRNSDSEHRDVVEKMQREYQQLSRDFAYKTKRLNELENELKNLRRNYVSYVDYSVDRMKKTSRILSYCNLLVEKNDGDLMDTDIEYIPLHFVSFPPLIRSGLETALLHFVAMVKNLCDFPPFRKELDAAYSKCDQDIVDKYLCVDLVTQKYKSKSESTDLMKHSTFLDSFSNLSTNIKCYVEGKCSNEHLIQKLKMLSDSCKAFKQDNVTVNETSLELDDLHYSLNMVINEVVKSGLKVSIEVNSGDESPYKGIPARYIQGLVKVKRLNELVEELKNNLSSSAIEKNRLLNELKLLSVDRVHIGSDHDTNVTTEETIRRESKIKDYFNERLNEIVIDKQISISELALYKSEVESLKKHLQDGVRRYRNLERELSECHSTCAQLREELGATANNYQLQLQTMSDHLATVNVQITTQRDTIDMLRQAQSHHKHS